MRGNYLLDGHTPVLVDDIITWAKGYEKMDRRVGLTEINANLSVSTVFLGLDHNFGGEGLPLLFESMAFLNGEECDCERYTDWEDAERGHKRMVEKWQAEAGKS